MPILAVFLTAGCQRAGASADESVSTESVSAAVADAFAVVADAETIAPEVPAAASQDGQFLLFEHDFGIIRPHERVTHTFLVKNRNARPWTLRHIGRTCVCTVAKCPEIIFPGDEAEIDVEYRATGAMADDHRAIEIRFKEPDAPIVRFDVLVAVRPAAAPSVKELVFRGTGKSYHERQTFQLENFSGVEWPSLTVTADEAWISGRAELSHIEPAASGRRQVWDIVVDADAHSLKPGRHSAAVEVRNDDDVLTRVPVSVDLALPLTPSPERIFFDNLDEHGFGECTVRLICRERTAAEVLSHMVVRHDLGQHLEISLTPRGERVLGLRATINVPADTPMLRGTAVIQYGNDDETRIELPISAGR